jgi:chromosome segregation ATPase
MTPEELNRTMAFIVASQAQTSATLDRITASLDRTNATLDKTNATLDRTNATLDRTNASLDKTNATLDRTNASLDRLEAAQEEDRQENKKMFKRLSDLQAQQADVLVHQSERMDRLDKVHADLTRQIVHLLNMILDRLPPLLH